MTLILYAQPYDTTAEGFYFRTAEEYHASARVLCNRDGYSVEEFEIEFIDGKDIDCELAKAIGINQANFADFLDCAAAWDDRQKQRMIIAVDEGGHRFNADTNPDDLDIEIYEVDTLRELAEQFVDEGLFGEASESLQYYIDYDAIARDLGVEYCETEIAGQRLIYRCN